MKRLWIAVVLVAVILAGCAGYVPGQQSYWDAQVREMCAKDGGVKVFETVRLNQKQYSLLLNKFGQLSPPLENKAGENVPIVHRFTSTYLRRSDPEVRRDELLVIRRSDGKVLGISIFYSRVGGGFSCSPPLLFFVP